MVTNGFGQPPWTNQTFENVGLVLLQKTVFGATEEERILADRWKGVLESTFKTLLDYCNKYKVAYGEPPITAIWDYPLASPYIYEGQKTEVYIQWDGQKYLQL
jgi:hypothetical protein